ncbi:hypothetical protein [Nocardia terpenica]|uniref:bestrophin-like domain n=1 Tax=Nocardia terpenica TaxID=455432 RepID=UPI002B4B1012|nr:hypothetical protein [Nocardia terpenica]
MIGASVNIALMCLFIFEHRTAHLLLTGLLAFFLATMIYLIAAMDFPFRDDPSISPGPFHRMYINAMRQCPPSSSSRPNDVAGVRVDRLLERRRQRRHHAEDLSEHAHVRPHEPEIG